MTTPRVPVVPRGAGPGLVGTLATAASYADEVLLGAARQAHQTVADRAFGIVDRGMGPAARVPHAIHDGLSGGVYGSLSLALRTAAAALAEVSARGPGHLQGHRGPAVSVRADGRSVPLEPEALRSAFPGAGRRVVIFLHGPGGSELQWQLHRRQLGGTYGTRLAAAAGWTPVYLRSDTGLGLAASGVALTALVQALVDAWPAEVRRIAMVGHTAGGLVLRAACAVATRNARPWTDRLSDVVTLGLGRDLGRDLGHRSVVALERGLPELPALPHVRYRVVSAGVDTRRSLLDVLLGDVRARRAATTASTRTALRLFPEAQVLHVPGAEDAALLNHPDVCRALRQWLG